MSLGANVFFVDQLNVEAGKALHIGDDQKADKFGAKAVGIVCWWDFSCLKWLLFLTNFYILITVLNWYVKTGYGALMWRHSLRYKSASLIQRHNFSYGCQQTTVSEFLCWTLWMLSWKMKAITRGVYVICIIWSSQFVIIFEKFV